MNTTTTTATTTYTVSFKSVRVNGTPRHEATIYANSKKVYRTTSQDRAKVREEAAKLVQNLKTYEYQPEKPIGILEEVWYLFRELNDAGKINHHLRAEVLLQRHRWTEEQALTMLGKLKEIQNA